jgi:serine/threonine protein kinase
VTVISGRLPPPAVPGLSGLSVLARGGYATVYRAMQDSVGREVAVKVENRILDNERDQRRFLREARAAGRMSGHPHVVDLFDCGMTSQGHPYLIMELCDGSYAERMRAGPLGAVEARDVGVKIADALADSHHLGVLHRDVKPANILVTRFGEPALADFGLAVLAEARDPLITLEVLTPAYAAPEMFQQGAPSPAVDVYALCVTLYTMMRGKPPRWRDDLDPSLLTLMELFTQPVPDIPGVPPALMETLRAGMANEPADRPSAAQLRDLLTAVRLDLWSGASAVSPVSPATPYYPWPSRTPPSPISAPPTTAASSAGPSSAAAPPSPAAAPPSPVGVSPVGASSAAASSSGPSSSGPSSSGPSSAAGSSSGLSHDEITEPVPDGSPTVPNARRRGLLGKLIK